MDAGRDLKSRKVLESLRIGDEVIIGRRPKDGLSLNLPIKDMTTAHNLCGKFAVIVDDGPVLFRARTTEGHEVLLGMDHELEEVRRNSAVDPNRWTGRAPSWTGSFPGFDKV